MLNLGLLKLGNKSNSVILSFKIPYYTHWGQHLLICGSEPSLGSWNVKKGLLLSPSHQGDELIWSASLSVPAEFKCEYSYYVVDDEKNVLRREAGNKRKVLLPEGIQSGELVELHDLWQTVSDDLIERSAFKNVIFRKNRNLEAKNLGTVESPPNDENSVIVLFRIVCPNIEKDSEVYVVGSSLKMGRWNFQDGIKLNYAGESVWKAECVMEKDEFPIKYPWRIFIA